MGSENDKRLKDLAKENPSTQSSPSPNPLSISQVQSNGSKKVIEKSWFKRGTILMVTGFRRDDQFIGKTYQSSKTHQLYKITDIIEDSIKLQHERATSENAIEEDIDE